MRAKLYLSVTFDQKDEHLIMSSFEKELKSFCSKSCFGARVTLSSDSDEIDIDDLGESILHYCKTRTVPDLSTLDGRILAYLQVVPEYSDEGGLKVFLSSDLLKRLGEHGFGLDIHEQDGNRN